MDHNANFREIFARGDRLLTFSETFYLRPVSWWDQRVGDVSLSSAAPEIVEIGVEPALQLDDVPPGPEMNLDNGIWIRSARISRGPGESLGLTVYWEAESAPESDYSVAVHLVAADPPQAAEDILSQADQVHPVYGWYPTSRWGEGEVVRDQYLIDVPDVARPQAIRVAMYRTDASGGFINTPWMSLPVPD